MDSQRQFVELLGQHERQLSGYILSLVPNWADADDILQQTRIRLWEQFGEYQPRGDFGAWARAIAFYQIRTHRKRSGRQSQRISGVALDKLADELVLATEQLSARHLALAECLERLPVVQRDFLARCYSGLETLKDVATSVGSTHGAVRQKVFGLRRLLHLCVEDQLGSET